MRLFLFSVVLVALLYVAQVTEAAIQCDKDTCQRVRCKMISRENCLGGGPAGRFEYREKGDVCGCCPTCVTILNENEDCSEMMVLDKADTKICGPNLQCNFQRRVCEKKQN